MHVNIHICLVYGCIHIYMSKCMGSRVFACLYMSSLLGEGCMRINIHIFLVYEWEGACMFIYINV